MIEKPVDYLYIAATIVFTAYGQLIIKWRINNFGELPATISDKCWFMLKLLLDPAIMSGIAAAFFASIAWMVAMTKFELSYAYPFISLNFLIVILLSGWLFDEPLSSQKILGVVIVIIGTVVATRQY